MIAGIVLIDTDILIDAGRRIAPAATVIDRIERSSKPVVSAITQMELIVGCRNKVELAELNRSLLRFTIVKLTHAISDTASDLLTRYRLSHGLLIPDALIAATALAFDYPLLTKNQRDFRFIADLNLLPYP